MPQFQNNSNIQVVIRRETTTGTAAGATASLASRMRVIGSPGLELKRAQIQSEEKRGDGIKSMGRLGGKSVDGSFNSELVVGGWTDIALEAIMRSTMTAARAIPFASMTTLAFGTNTITAAGGDFLATQSVRVGDIFTITGTSLAANNNINAAVVAITTLTLTTTSGVFTTLAATSTGTMTMQKKVITGTSVTRYSHTIEQYDADTDLSELFLGCRLVGMKLSFKPNAMATAQYTFMGLDRTALATGTSPYFTTPIVNTNLALIADDSAVRKSGVLVTTFTGFDLDFSLAAKGEPVIGSFVTPDIFDNDLTVSGSITALRSDFANLTSFDAETEFEVGIMLQDPSATPKPVLGIYLPRVKISQLSAPVGGNDGAKIEQLTLMVGGKTAATGYDASIATFCSSGSTP